MVTHQYGKASISQISEYAMAKMPTVTKIVGRLREDGLVTTASSENDARVTEVMLTDAGRQKVEEAMAQAGKVFEKGFKGMTRNQVAKMNLSWQKSSIISTSFKPTKPNDKFVTCVEIRFNSL